MKIGRLDIPALYLLLVFVPLAVLVELLHAPPGWIFACSAVAIIPIAGLMGKSTEHLAAHYGPGVGGLLNATFGNAAEVIIALIALKEGYVEIVKASLTGSIIGNVLLVLGLALLCGGLRYPRLKFNRTAAGLGATALMLSAIGLMVPAIFHATSGLEGEDRIQQLSLAIAVVLFVTYVLTLVFQLKTHQHLYGEGHEHEGPVWSQTRALAMLIGATVLVAVMSELLVGAVEGTAESWGMTEVFVGVIVVAIIGNAAEHSTAILVALKGHMDLSLTIAIGSSAQIALFVAPLLVFVSYAFGAPMDLEFTTFEVVAVVFAVLVVSLVALDGESHWMEGVMLLAVYVILAIAFYFLPAH